MTYFITQYNLINLIKNFDENIPFYYRGYYKKTLLTDFALKVDFFTEKEAKALCIAQKLFKGLIKINQLYYLNKTEKESKNWVYEIKSPAYHKQDKCSNLLSRFENYLIPKSCSQNRVEEYRTYFKENIEKYGNHSGQIEPTVFARKLKNIFELTEDVHYILSEYVIPYIRKNSGVENVYFQLSKDNLINKIAELRQYIEDGYDKTIIARSGILKDSEELAEEYKADLENINELRKTIFYSLLNYYLFSLKKDGLDITKEYLEILGFRPCKDCC